MKSVLVVDDEAGMRMALEASFRRDGWQVTTAAGTTDAIAQFRTAPCPVVVTDMRMPDGTGMEIMRRVRTLAPGTVVILLTAFANVPDAVLAMKDGACDYLIKPVSFEHLKEVIERALTVPKQLPTGPIENRLIGGSACFRKVIEGARHAARTEADILIEAESGTGKEVVARFIHSVGSRSGGPFVAVNCAAFPETLLESELFGHIRGAFTGATATKPGKFEIADGGTLLLDEIGDMPLSLQPKLLRVLQEREVDRLGDTRPVKVDVRVIATTNRSFLELVEEGKFRQDLYYRLNVIPLTIPPLREHREDIPALAEYFVGKYANRSTGRAVSLSAEFLARLQEHSWPGNVRELENFIRRALALSEGPVVGVAVLDGIQFPKSAQSRRALEAGLTLREAEKQLLEKTLEAVGGNRTRAAGMLGVSLRTIRNKIREYGLPPREFA